MHCFKRHVRKQLANHPKPYHPQVLQCLIRLEQSGVLKNPKRPVHPVLDQHSILIHQLSTRVLFITDDVGDHFTLDLAEQHLVTATKRDLVGDLIELSRRLRSLAV